MYIPAQTWNEPAHGNSPSSKNPFKATPKSIIRRAATETGRASNVYKRICDDEPQSDRKPRNVTLVRNAKRYYGLSCGAEGLAKGDDAEASDDEDDSDLEDALNSDIDDAEREAGALDDDCQAGAVFDDDADGPDPTNGDSDEPSFLSENWQANLFANGMEVNWYPDPINEFLDPAGHEFGTE